MTDEEDKASAATIGIELETSVGLRYATFPPGDDRAFVVGSAADADVRIARSAIDSIEFHIERVGDDLQLRLAHGAQKVFVNGRRVMGIATLGERSVIEFADQSIIAATFDASGLDGLLPVPDKEQSGIAYIMALPGENEPTRVFPPHPRQINVGVHDFPTVPLMLGDFPGPGFTEQIDLSQLQKPPLERSTTPARDLAADTTAFDVHPASVSEAPPTSALTARAPLTRLGILAKKRPVPVVLAAVTLAAVFSVFLASASKSLGYATTHVSPTRPPTTGIAPPPEGVPLILASAIPAASVVIVRTTMVVPAPTTSASLSKATPSQGPLDPELAEATAHLAAGRDARAISAYARLAARSPENRAYSALSELLERFAAPVCSGTTAAGISCPEVKR
jgi:hypothetical protein